MILEDISQSQQLVMVRVAFVYFIISIVIGFIVAVPIKILRIIKG